MRKKSWLIGTAALAAAVTFGALGVHSVKATESDSNAAKEQIVFENIGKADTYTSIAQSQYGVMLQTKDGKYYAKISSDGTVAELDNSDGKYQTIALSSSNGYDNAILSIDKENNGAVLNYDGTFAYGTDKYYSKIFGLRAGGKSLCAFVEDGRLIVNDISGAKIIDAELPENKDVSVSVVKNKYIVVSCRVGDNGPYAFKTMCYDTDGKEVDESQVFDSVDYDSVNYGTNASGLVFKEYSDVKFDNGYRASNVGVLKGQKVYYANKSGENYPAILDEDGNVILSGIAGTYSAFNDTIATRKYVDVDNKKNGSVYNITKAVLATGINKDSDNNSVSSIVAEDVDLDAFKDSEGNSVTYDSLDADAQVVYNKKFNFSLKAADGVIADGATLSVVKVVTGDDYEAAKAVTKDVANHIAVFNIDLLKDRVKIQPNGNVEFTVDIPDNFKSELVAVYRLSADGNSYTKLESSVKDDKVTFVTDHFSTYMIVEEKEQAANPSDSENGGSATTATDKTATGDVYNYAMYIAAIICAMGVFAVVCRKKAK